MGLPFYARPTDKSRVWYDYGDDYDKLDREGDYVCPETSLTFSFNTEDVISKLSNTFNSVITFLPKSPPPRSHSQCP